MLESPPEDKGRDAQARWKSKSAASLSHNVMTIMNRERRL